jgi:hypothetical protein
MILEHLMNFDYWLFFIVSFYFLIPKKKMLTMETTLLLKHELRD